MTATSARARSGAESAGPPDWRRTRLHVVSGKGGAGKTTVAAALSIALATGGRKVLLIEVEERQSIASVLDVAPLGYQERQVASAPGGGQVVGLAVDPHQALVEYLATYFKVPRRAAGTLERMGAIDFVTTIAPGLRDVLLTGKVYEATRRRRRDRDRDQAGYAYDAVVVDAPPTGRVVRFLDVTTDVASLAKVGPIHRQAQSIAALMRSPMTAVHLVALLEELPAQETVEAVAALRAAALPVGSTIVNMARPLLLSPTQLRAARRGELAGEAIGEAMGKELAAVGVHDGVVVELLLAEAADYAEGLALEQRARRLLRSTGRPVVELPQIEGGVEVGDLYELAAALRAQGLVMST